MILKEKIYSASTNPKTRAGEDAEKQMAFYLQRAFSKETSCFVLNDLRILFDGEVAQIDHLIVTEYGLFIVESKSVYGKITVNKDCEWSRTSKDSSTGMASPVLQAKAQGEVLIGLLKANKEKMLTKLLGALQKGFGYCPVNIYIAISDTGIIERKITIPELLKADQVCDAIKSKLSDSKKISSLLSLSMNKGWAISESEAKSVANFLLSAHTPKLIQSENINNIASRPLSKKVDGADISHAPKAKNEIDLKVNDSCPKCSIGKLVLRKAKTEFLGCSAYPKCKFTSYR